MSRLFGQLEARQKEHGQAAARPRGLPEPEWESLRQALYGPNGPADDPGDDRSPAAVPQPAAGQSARGAQRGHRSAECDRPGGPGPGHGDEGRAPARSSRTSSSAATRAGRARRSRGGSSACWPARSRPRSSKGSGRLELAQAIADPENPLTARVLVNRVWHWHFGKGLVTTPSDFGLRSDPPSHPELLD